MEMSFGREAVIQFCKCNAFKYLWRYKNKNGKEDLEKALWYCNRALKIIERYYGSEYEDEQIIVMVAKTQDILNTKRVNKEEEQC